MPQNNTSSRRRPTAIDDLAVLPVFWKLRGKRVLLAGGSDAAAWKAELLCAAGAQLTLCAEHCETAMQDLLEGKHAAKIDWHPRNWTAQDMQGVELAIADAETQHAAQEFFDAARNAGLPVNVIDQPNFCSFQFGSIVNRSPVVVGISTDGAAPVLGQAIRRRIETLLPPALQSWAGFAKQIRDRITNRFANPQDRRAFWQRFAEAAFKEETGHRSIDSVLAEFAPANQPNATNSKTGAVTLVGAGPGDPDLLTVMAIRALQGADVILFDALVSDEILEMARREAKRMLVGKRGGRESCKQDDINEMMVSLARAGKNVVRLKAGDPMIFGRAGEEIERLKSAGIHCSVVPGITAASAMASELGVSLTKRGVSQSVQFITGHSRNGKLPDDIDWSAIARQGGTTVFYMGGRTAGQIVERLKENGLDGNHPVSIVSSVTGKRQKSWNGSLDTLPQGIDEIGYEDPVLIGIGEVFKEAIQGQTFGQISLVEKPRLAVNQ